MLIGDYPSPEGAAATHASLIMALIFIIASIFTASIILYVKANNKQRITSLITGGIFIINFVVFATVVYFATTQATWGLILNCICIYVTVVAIFGTFPLQQYISKENVTAVRLAIGIVTLTTILVIAWIAINGIVEPDQVI